MRVLILASTVLCLSAGAVAFGSQPQSSAVKPKNTERPSLEERLAAWRATRPGQPVQALVQFRRPLADQQVKAILDRHRAKP